MKINAIILKSGLIAWGALTIISCDKQETETNFPNEAILEEGFKSTTKHFDSEIEESQETLTPLLHRSYDASLTEEEVQAKFEKEISNFIKEEGVSNKTRFSFYCVMFTRTGSGRHGNTNGKVYGRAAFDSDKGPMYLRGYLDNPGNDRELGQWDSYLLYGHGPQLRWIKARYASIELQGTDGWYVSDLNVYATQGMQPPLSNSVGSTFIISSPATWLDNNTSSGWDYYSTGNIGQGQLWFQPEFGI